jgi:hypothetical protein
MDIGVSSNCHYLGVGAAVNPQIFANLLFLQIRENLRHENFSCNALSIMFS